MRPPARSLRRFLHGALFAAALLAAASLVAEGAVELRLKGGTLVTALEVEREGDSYQVSLPDGSLVSIPAELVVGIGVSQEMKAGGDEADPGAEEDGPKTSDDAAVKRTERPRYESRNASPALADPSTASPVPGAPAEPPPEQTKDEGPPPNPFDATRPPEPEEPLEGMDRLRDGSFKKTGTDPTWTPESDWSEETDVSNFAPVEWKKSGVDPEWKPESDWSEETDVTDANEVEWKKPAIDPTWRPKDAFGRTNTSFGVDPASVGSRSVENGIASWYGEPFEGKTTASGAIYDMNAFTAAHPTLPFGTLVKVVDKSTGRAVPVKVTDRGPSIPGRVINLSYAAARQLGIVERGIADVAVETLDD